MYPNTILIREDKTLIPSRMRAIYEGENRSDGIQFLISPNVFDGIDEFVRVILMVILPYPDEEAGTPTTNKMRYMEIEPEPYKNRYRTILPITNVLTKARGPVTLWFNFFNLQDYQHVKLLKTEAYTFDVLPVLGDASSIIDDDESYDVLEQIQRDITALEESRMDKDFIYDSETQTIQFYSNGEPVGEPVPLDTEVHWRNFDD